MTVRQDVGDLNPRAWQRRALRDANGGGGDFKHDREPEVPARVARRRDIICRSMGEEYTDGRHKGNGQYSVE